MAVFQAPQPLRGRADASGPGEAAARSTNGTGPVRRNAPHEPADIDSPFLDLFGGPTPPPTDAAGIRVLTPRTPPSDEGDAAGLPRQATGTGTPDVSGSGHPRAAAGPTDRPGHGNGHAGAWSDRRLDGWPAVPTRTPPADGAPRAQDSSGPRAPAGAGEPAGAEEPDAGTPRTAPTGGGLPVALAD
ncbi:MAG TPA: hypothetical protein VHI50_06125, partial [Micromonosporaceae bacterium]|nr:hypothetical protein [Micromonosporaceae bacterium]